MNRFERTVGEDNEGIESHLPVGCIWRSLSKDIPNEVPTKGPAGRPLHLQYAAQEIIVGVLEEHRYHQCIFCET